MSRRAAPELLTAADSLFDALDGRLVTFGRRKWRLNVCGIFSESNQRWVQIKLTGRPDYLLTIRLDDVAEAPEYYSAVTNWLAHIELPSRTIVSCTVLDFADSSRNALKLVP